MFPCIYFRKKKKKNCNVDTKDKKDKQKDKNRFDTHHYTHLRFSLYYLKHLKCRFNKSIKISCRQIHLMDTSEKL